MKYFWLCLLAVILSGCGMDKAERAPDLESVVLGDVVTPPSISVWSETVPFTNDITVSVNGRHDHPMLVTSVHVTFPANTTNTFQLYRTRPMGSWTNTDHVLSPTNPVAYTTYSWYFASPLCFKLDDEMYLTNSSALACRLTYDYLKGAK